MKALIWIFCILLYAVVVALFQSAGVILGAIPTMLLTAAVLFGAPYLCKKWDASKARKNEQQPKEKQREKFTWDDYAAFQNRKRCEEYVDYLCHSNDVSIDLTEAEAHEFVYDVLLVFFEKGKEEGLKAFDVYALNALSVDPVSNPMLGIKALDL